MPTTSLLLPLQDCNTALALAPTRATKSSSAISLSELSILLDTSSPAKDISSPVSHIIRLPFRQGQRARESFDRIYRLADPSLRKCSVLLQCSNESTVLVRLTVSSALRRGSLSRSAMSPSSAPSILLSDPTYLFLPQSFHYPLLLLLSLLYFTVSIQNAQHHVTHSDHPWSAIRGTRAQTRMCQDREGVC